jgi:1-acyl-sn-glycerol-3-phosphate acyltransferase
MAPMARRSLLMRGWYRCVQYGCRMGSLVFFRFRSRGMDHVPATGPVLILSNHQSHLDPGIIGGALRRPCNYLARETLFHFGPFGWLIRSLDAVPLDRGGLGLSGIKEVLRRLKAGEIVLIFPEGTRTPNGELLPMKPGFLALARRAGATLVPMAIDGAYQAWPKQQMFPRPGTVRIQVGPPIGPEEAAKLDDDQLMAEVTGRIADCLAAAREQIQRANAPNDGIGCADKEADRC